MVKFPFSLRRVVYSFAAAGNLFNSVLRGHGRWGDGMDADVNLQILLAVSFGYDCILGMVLGTLLR